MAKRKHKKLTIVGKTIDGKIVISGEDIFKYVDTLGIDLRDIVELLIEKDLVVDWQGFYNKARSCNWNSKTIMAKIKEIIEQLYYDDIKVQIIKRLAYLDSTRR